MTRLADVLAWKFNFAPGIRTREGEGAEEGGEMVIFDWPEALGPQPTSDQIAQWAVDYEAREPDPVDLDIQEIWRILKTKGTVTDADLPTNVRKPPDR